jgi:hypothetical protein
MTTNEIDDKPIESYILDPNNDVLDQQTNVWAFLFVLISMMKNLKYLKLLIDIGKYNCFLTFGKKNYNYQNDYYLKN